MRILGALAGLLTATASLAGTLVDDLLAQYARIETLSCDMRKDTDLGGDQGRMISRIFFKAPDIIHVSNTTPFERTILSDGTNLYSYSSGEGTGFFQALAGANEAARLQTLAVPGTAMEHLLRLKGVAETNLEARGDFPVRRGYAAEKVFAVLSLDARGRLARIEFYKTAEMDRKVAQYDYSMFDEVLPGVWIPLKHEGFLEGDKPVSEARRVSNLVVNKPLDEALFDRAIVFPGYEFKEAK